jgi:hypothetical protein
MLLEDMAVEKFKKKTQPNPPLNIDDQTSKWYFYFYSRKLQIL